MSNQPRPIRGGVLLPAHGPYRHAIIDHPTGNVYLVPVNPSHAAHELNMTDKPSNPTTMALTIPTVEFMLDATLNSNGIHRWPTEGGEIQIATAELRPALEAAYDPTMTNWPAMVEIEDA